MIGNREEDKFKSNIHSYITQIAESKELFVFYLIFIQIPRKSKHFIDYSNKIWIINSQNQIILQTVE